MLLWFEVMEILRLVLRQSPPLLHSTEPHATVCVVVVEPEVRLGTLF